MTRVLVSSAGDKVPLVAGLSNCRINQIDSLEIIAADTRADSLSFHFAKESYIVPSTSVEHLQTHVDFCRRHAIDLVIPTRDGEMEFWSQNQAHFLEIGTRVAISPSKTVIECSDKLKFFQTLAAHNLPVIPTALDPDGLLSETYVVKERFGSGSHNIGLNLLAENARSFSQDLNSPIFQTFIRGTEYSVDVWRSRSGNLTVCSARTRDLIIGGEAKITSTVDNPDLVAISKSIADLLDVCGIAVIQFIIDARGGIWIIECNPRIGGATTASVAAGLPLFELLIRDNLDLDCVQLAESSVRKEITQIRAEKDFIFHR